MTSTMGSHHRPGVSRASVRPPIRQVKSSLARHASAASRLDRSGAISPAESVSSATTTATTGTKRKEREYEADEGGESTNINVVVRCRGRNEREVKENSTVVVRTDGAKGNIVELSMGPNALSNKTYNFDRVFSPAADQSMVFDEVVKPILDEVSRDMRWCIPSFLCINHDLRSFPGTTAPSLPMDRLAQGRHTPCPVT